MIRNVRDKKVVKAIAIGLATMITTSSMTPMAVYAADGTADNDSKIVKDTTSNTDNAVADVKDAEDKVDDIETFDPKEDGLTETALKDLNAGFANLEDVENDIDTASDNLNGNPDMLIDTNSNENTSVKTDIAIADYNKDTSKSEKAVDDAKVEVKKAQEAADDAIDAANIANGEAKKNAEIANKDAGIINEAADAANDLVKAGQDKIDEILDIISKANEAIQEAQEKFDKSSSLDGKKKYQDSMTKTYEEANANYESSLSEYNKIKEELAKAAMAYENAKKSYEEEYNSAKESYKGSTEDFDDAKSDYDDASEDFNDAKAGLEKAVEDYNEQANRYNNAINNANTKLGTAETKLKDAKEKLDELNAAALAAQKEIDENAADALDIIAKQKELSEGSKLDWDKADAFFESYIKNYYATEVKNYGEVTVNKIEVKSNDIDYNYFEVRYKDENGDDAVACLNYKLGWDNSSYSGEKLNLVVFEKTEDEVLVTKAIIDSKAKANGFNAYRYTDENGTTHYVIVTEDAAKDYVADGNGGVEVVEGTSIQSVDNKLFAVVDGKVEELITSGTETYLTETEKKETIVAKDTTERYVLDSEGKVVKQISADVTTITYTKNTLNSEKNYETKEDAQAALDGVLEDYSKEQIVSSVVTNDEIETVVGQTATVDASAYYASAFKSTIELGTEYENGEVDIEKFANDVKTKAESKAVAVGKTAYVDGNNLVYVVSSDISVKVEVVEGGQSDTYKATATQEIYWAKIASAEIKHDKIKTTFGFSPKKFGDILDASRYAQTTLTKNVKKYYESLGYPLTDIKIQLLYNESSDNYKYKVEVKYVKTTKVSVTVSGNGDTQDAALVAAKEAAQPVLDKEAGVTRKLVGSVATENEKYEDLKQKTTQYGYTVVCWDEKTKETENAVVAKQTTTSAKLSDDVTNSNWNQQNGTYTKTKDDEEYQSFLKKRPELTDKYEKLVEQVKVADEAVADAKKSVESIKEQLKDYTIKQAIEGADPTLTEWAKKYETKIEELKELLEIEEAKLEEAQALKDELKKQLENNKKKIDEMKREEAKKNEGNDSEPTPLPSPTNVVIGTPVTVLAAPIVRNLATAVANANNEDAVAGDVIAEAGEVTLTDKEVALAAEPENVDASKVSVGDNDVALVAAPTAEDTAGMNWWWSLVVAALGSVGYAIYKKQQDKRALKAESNKSEE